MWLKSIDKMPHQSDAVYHAFFGLATTIPSVLLQDETISMIYYTICKRSKSTTLRHHAIPCNPMC